MATKKKQSTFAAVSPNAPSVVPPSTQEMPVQAMDDDAPAVPSSEDRVREAAYRRFVERGSVHGHHEDDWREAEKEVRPPEGN
jgi:hypothetical protein